MFQQENKKKYALRYIRKQKFQINPINTISEQYTNLYHSKDNVNAFFHILDADYFVRVTKTEKIVSTRIIAIFGNKMNTAGLGIGKSENFFSAILYARNNALKNLFFIPLTISKSIPTITTGYCNKSKIILYPAKEGKGIRSSQQIYTLLFFLGFRNIYTKQLGSNNILNNIYSTLNALKILL